MTRRRRHTRGRDHAPEDRPAEDGWDDRDAEEPADEEQLEDRSGLKPCPTCGRGLDPQAPSCPGCGWTRPMTLGWRITSWTAISCAQLIFVAMITPIIIYIVVLLKW